MRVAVNDEKDESYVIQLEKENLFDFWTVTKAKQPVDIMTSPERLELLKSRLSQQSLNWTVMIDNVQTLIDLEKIPSEGKYDKQNLAHNMEWVEYHSLEDIYE